MRTAALLLSLLVAPSTFAADSDATATGTLRSQSATLELRSAVAFRGRPLVDQADALIVAVSNARLDSGAIADYLDGRRVLEARVKDGDTTVVYFEFTPKGAYRGMSYLLGPGNGCDFCAGEVTSTVEVARDRVSGTLTRGPTDPTLTITLAVPVIAGEASGGRIVGEALLVREAGRWRVDDEITEKVR